MRIRIKVRIMLRTQDDYMRVVMIVVIGMISMTMMVSPYIEETTAKEMKIPIPFH